MWTPSVHMCPVQRLKKKQAQRKARDPDNVGNEPISVEAAQALGRE